jgi:hypothetical protein
MFSGLKPLRTHYKLNGGASLVGRKVTLPTNAPTSATTLLRKPCPPPHLLVGLILFLLLLGRTMSTDRSIMSQWRKPRKLRTWSLVHFSSTTLLQLCCLILEHRIISYPLHMPARQLCPKVNFKIRGVDFVANLIVLESKGIDVILGMD